MGRQLPENGKFDHAQLLSAQSLETLNGTRKQLSETSFAGALARGKVFELVGYFVEAADSYNEALSYDRSNPEATARLALSQLKAGNFDGALATAMSVAASEPGFQIKALATEERVSALTILGDALVANGRLKDASEAYQAARKISSKDSYAAGRLAEIHLANGEPKLAVELRRDFSNNPRFSSLNSLLAMESTSAALLPRFTAESLIARLRGGVLGRPLLVDGQPRLASIVEGDDGWCAELTQVGYR
jgi:tetratricopeptide (TPR) repeat protein